MTTRRFRCPPIVEVEWLDSMAFPGWCEGNVAIERMDQIDDLRHRTCGYLVKRTQQYIGIALSVGWAGTTGDVLQIPAQAVKRVATLRKGDYNNS